MNNIIKLPFFVFCLLLSFNAISAVDIVIIKGFKWVGSERHQYVCREEVKTGTGWDYYDDFIRFLTELRHSGNPSSAQLRRSERLRAVTASAVSLQASGSSGLAVPLPLMSESPFVSADASAVTVEEVEPVTLDDEHIPFSDLKNLSDYHDLDADECRRLRKDFIAFKEIAFEQLVGESDRTKLFTQLYNFFLKNLEYAHLENTVIRGGS